MTPLFSHRVTGWALRRRHDGRWVPINTVGHRPELFPTEEAALNRVTKFGAKFEAVFVTYTETLEPGENQA